MLENNNTYLFLDIDGVLTTPRQRLYSNQDKWDKRFNIYNFDMKAVKVLNEILEETNPIIILSSDWRINYDINTLNDIFVHNKVNEVITDTTEDFWGDRSLSLYHSELEMYRANEIIAYVHNYQIKNYVVVDDFNLAEWFPNNFVHTSKVNMVIKQTGIKEKIIKILNNEK